MVPDLTRFTLGLIRILIAAVLAAMPELVTAQSPADSAAFGGLQPVAVGVDVHESLQRYVSAGRLKTLMELELRRSGLQVADIGSDLRRDGNLILVLIALPDEARSGEVVGFSVARRVDFYQGVTIARNDMFGVASTWDDDSVHYLGISRARDASENAARAAVESFINRYLANR